MRIYRIVRGKRELIPVFYTRGLNPPYTEGHIQIVRMFAKSLSLYGTKSIIFNFKYRTSESKIENDFASKFLEQRIPIVGREEVISGRSRQIIAYSSLMETLAIQKFLFFETTLKRKSYIVNIVNCFRYPRIFAKRLLKAPLVLHYYIPHLRGRYMMRLFGNRADLIIASSQLVAHYLEKYGIAKEKIVVIYPPVDTELYKPLNKHVIRSNLDLPRDVHIILYLGDLKRTRFPENKILRVMSELVHEIPEVLLLILAPKTNLNIERAHEIYRNAKMLGLANKVKIQVENLSENDKTSIYQASDIFFFPRSGSRVAVEPPITVLEAMASGKVVFAPKLSASSEIITDKKDGFLFEEKDYNELADKFAKIITNRKLKTRMSRYARQTVEQKSSLLTAGSKMFEHFSFLESYQGK